MTETQPGREPEQGSGPEREYADAEDVAGAESAQPNEDLHGLAREVTESSEGDRSLA